MTYCWTLRERPEKKSSYKEFRCNAVYQYTISMKSITILLLRQAEIPYGWFAPEGSACIPAITICFSSFLKRKKRYKLAAAFLFIPGTLASSSSVAFFISSRERKACQRAFLRVGPIPSTWSRIDSVLRLFVQLLWYVITKRCASSRMNWRSCSAGSWWSSTTGTSLPST